MVRSVQVVSISSLKGGVGKTSVTLGLASAALAAGIPTLVIDLDPHADASTGLGVRADGKMTIGRMLKAARKANLSDNIVSSSWQAKAVSKRSLTRVPGARCGSGRRLHRHLRPTGPARPRSAPADPAAGQDLGLRAGAHRLPAFAQRADPHGVERQRPHPAGCRAVACSPWPAPNAPSVPWKCSARSTPRISGRIDVVANRVRKDSDEHRFRLTEMRSMFGASVLSPELPGVRRLAADPGSRLLRAPVAGQAGAEDSGTL